MKLQSIDNITIIGGGTAGHITTLFLSKKFPNKNIKWIFPKKNDTIGVGEATVPYVQNFLNDLGISIKDILTLAKGNLKIGIKFQDFFQNKETYNPFGKSIEEQNLILSFIKTNLVPNDIFENYDIATQFNVTYLLPIIYDMVKNNVQIERREFNENDFNTDLVIDCTGFQRKVINKIVKNNIFKDSRILNDSALVYRSKEIFDEPFSTFSALNNGWVWKIPLKEETTFGFVFDNKRLSEKEARKLFQIFLNKNKIKSEEKDFHFIKMTTGRNIKHFFKRDKTIFTSIGLSSFFIEPLESTGLYFVAYSLNLLEKVLKEEITTNEYEKLFNDDFDGTTNFIIAHFKYSNHPDYDIYNNFEINKQKMEIFLDNSWNFIEAAERSEIKFTPEIIKILKKSKSFKIILKEKGL